MNHPGLYMKQYQIGRIGSTNIIEKYFHLLNENTSEEIAIIDIGSGPGNFTHDVLVSLFKNPIRKVVGVDISDKMVEFANATFKNKNLSFEVLNIGDTVPEDYISFFDYVFSFLTYQWVKDQRQLFLNINRIMKPNGQMLFSSIANSIIFDIYQLVWRRPEYAPYIDDFYAGQSCFQKSKDPVKELQEIIQNAGFEVAMIKIEKVEAKNKPLDDFKDFLIAINPYYNKMPNHLKEKFMLDHLVHIKKDAEVEGPNNYYLNFNVFVVYAKKK